MTGYSKHIRKIEWDSCGFNGENNPFIKNNLNRKLSITIDDRNLAKIKGNEKKYLEILYELIDHKMLDFYVVDDRNLPQIEIGREVVENQYYPVKVNYPEPEKRRITGIRDLNAVSVKIEEVYQAHPLCEIKP